MVKVNIEDVVAFLKSAPATVGEVAAKVGTTKQAANRVLANLRKAGKVAVVSSRNKGEHKRGRPEFLYGVLAPGQAVEVSAAVEAIDVPVVVAPVEETKTFSFDETDRP